MSSLTFSEKRQLEQLLGMGSGYVLDLSNRTFSEFLIDSIGLDPADDRFNEAAGSKASRMREIWRQLPDPVVGKLLEDLVQLASQMDSPDAATRNIDAARAIVSRLHLGSSTSGIRVLSEELPDTFDALLASVHTSLAQGKPEEGLDRLHTLSVRYLRRSCDRLGISNDKKEPLSSLMGKLLKQLKQNGLVESAMSERILKSNISILEAFDHVRNNRSLAHDNETLSSNESNLIVAHIVAVLMFLQSIQSEALQATP